MQSSLPKVLHPVAGQSLLAHVLGAAPARNRRGARRGDRARPCRRRRRGQTRSRRCGHLRPARAARHRACGAGGPRRDRPWRGRSSGRVRRYAADLGRNFFAAARAAAERAPPSRCSAFAPPIPTGYGRLLVEDGRLVDIREQADASPAERAITLCNAGVMAFDGRKALKILERIGNANSKGEFYLVDAVAIGRDDGIGGGRDRNQRG